MSNGLIEYAVAATARGVYWGRLKPYGTTPDWLRARILTLAEANPAYSPYGLCGLINAELDALYELFRALGTLTTLKMDRSIKTFGRLEIE